MSVEDPSGQFRDLRAQAFSATFDRVVWLDAAALSGILAFLQGGACIGRCPRIEAAVWLLTISLVLTLCVPIWRAMVNARHVQTGRYRVAWEVYITQLAASLMTGGAIVLAVWGFSSAVL